MLNHTPMIILVVLLCILLPEMRRNQYMMLRLNRKKKGDIAMLPAELIKEFTGKVCSITLFNESFGITGRIEEIEENWLKVNEKGKSRLVNGDMVRDIKLMPDKYQK